MMSEAYNISLGNHRMAVRRVSNVRMARNMGMLWITLVSPLIVGLIGAFLVAGIALSQRVPVPILSDSFWDPFTIGAFIVGFLGMGYIAVFWKPRSGKLDLYDLGIQYGKRTIRYREMQRIYLGSQPTSLENTAAAVTRRLDSNAHKWSQDLRQSDVTIELTDGVKVVVKFLLIMYEPDDVAQMLDVVAAVRPELLPSQDGVEVRSNSG